MKRALIATRLFNVPLLADNGYAKVFVSALADDLGVDSLASPEEMAAHYRPTRYAAVYENLNGVAVIPVVGALVHRAGPSASASGSQGYAGTQNLLMEMAADPKVRGIILDLDTPGGEVGGVHELGEAIREVSEIKPVWAIANSIAASAGYWIGASASKFLATPFARVGSIGVVTMHMDMSKAAEKRGVVVTFVHAGRNKVAGHPFAALDEETRDRMQTLINETYDQFVSHVASARGLDEGAIRATEASIYSAKEALDLGLVDGISTLGQAIEQMRDHIAERARGVNIQGNQTMSTAPQTTEASAAAIAAARTEGATAERQRITGIMTHAEAADRPKLAMTLAGTDISVEQAGVILAAAAKETKAEAPAPQQKETPPADPKQGEGATATAILDHLRAKSPGVSGQEGADAEANRKAELAANLGYLKRKTA